MEVIVEYRSKRVKNNFILIKETPINKQPMDSTLRTFYLQHKRNLLQLQNPSINPHDLISQHTESITIGPDTIFYPPEFDMESHRKYNNHATAIDLSDSNPLVLPPDSGSEKQYIIEDYHDIPTFIQYGFQVRLPNGVMLPNNLSDELDFNMIRTTLGYESPVMKTSPSRISPKSRQRLIQTKFPRYDNSYEAYQSPAERKYQDSTRSPLKVTSPLRAVSVQHANSIRVIMDLLLDNMMFMEFLHEFLKEYMLVIEDYIGSDYLSINQVKKLSTQQIIDEYESKQAIRMFFKLLAVFSHPLCPRVTEDITLYRGIRRSGFLQDLSCLRNDPQRCIYSQNGFLSTSVNLHVASQFAHHHPNPIITELNQKLHQQKTHIFFLHHQLEQEPETPSQHRQWNHWKTKCKRLEREMKKTEKDMADLMKKEFPAYIGLPNKYIDPEFLEQLYQTHDLHDMHIFRKRKGLYGALANAAKVLIGNDFYSANTLEVTSVENVTHDSVMMQMHVPQNTPILAPWGQEEAELLLPAGLSFYLLNVYQHPTDSHMNLVDMALKSASVGNWFNDRSRSERVSLYKLIENECNHMQDMQAKQTAAIEEWMKTYKPKRKRLHQMVVHYMQQVLANS